MRKKTIVDTDVLSFKDITQEVREFGHFSISFELRARVGLGSATSTCVLLYARSQSAKQRMSFGVAMREQMNMFFSGREQNSGNAGN